MCISTCSGSCISFLTSNTTLTAGPEREPTAPGYIYPNPINRWEERESFKITKDPTPYHPEVKVYPIRITVDKERNLHIEGPEYESDVLYETSIFGGVYNVDQSNGQISINVDMLTPEIEINLPNVDGGDGIFIAIVKTKNNVRLMESDIDFDLPIGFSGHLYGRTSDDRLIVVIERDIFMFPPEVRDE
ncbi:MAG: hypothetical protein NC131_11350 [Roseburia sp.]|nr:hypothetical protein [Roseburia sp.]